MFKAVNLWATNECERQGLTTDGEIKRSILRESIVKGKRFPVMKQDEFANFVLDSKILTSEEVITFFEYYNSALTSPLEFSESVRSGFHDHKIYRCGRFQCVRENELAYGGSPDCIDFTVDKDIMLHGLRLFGRKNNDYSVTLTIKRGDPPYQTLVYETERFPSKLLKSHCQ